MRVNRLVLLALAGFIAQLVDGALGMGYGVTSSSMLLALGLAPAVVSASVHAGEIVTTLISGVAHWRFGNVDRVMMWRLAIPGALGAFLGALCLSSLPVAVARPAVSLILLALGIVVLMRFFRGGTPQVEHAGAPPVRFLAPLGLAAGFLDATGGGGWGPVATSTLIARPNQDARKVVGSVDASEFLVAASATLGFVLVLGWESINLTWVMAIVVGGALAAPLAAWIVRRMPVEILGVTVGAMIVLSNARTLLGSFGVEVPAVVLLAVLAAPLLIVALSRIKGTRSFDTVSR